MGPEPRDVLKQPSRPKIMALRRFRLPGRLDPAAKTVDEYDV